MTKELTEEELLDKSLDQLIETVLAEDNPRAIDWRKAKRKVLIKFQRHTEAAVLEAQIKDTKMWIDSTKYKKEKIVLLRNLDLHLHELEYHKQKET